MQPGNLLSKALIFEVETISTTKKRLCHIINNLNKYKNGDSHLLFFSFFNVYNVNLVKSNPLISK